MELNENMEFFKETYDYYKEFDYDKLDLDNVKDQGYQELIMDYQALYVYCEKIYNKLKNEYGEEL